MKNNNRETKACDTQSLNPYKQRTDESHIRPFAHSSIRPIALIPIGNAPVNLLHSLVDPLSAIFGRPCQVGGVVPLPPSAYNRRRGQYAGRSILSLLAGLDVPNAGRVLGIVDADCYAPGLDFIFGRARMGVRARAAFIALPRLRQSFYNLAEDKPLFRKRALKEAIHELGHTYGLDHCPDVTCVMYSSTGLHDTDVKRAGFCLHCRTRL